MKLLMEKLPSGILAPVNTESESYLDKIKRGSIHEFDVTRKRNPKFLRKFFALLDVAFEAWEPGPINSRYGIPQKNPQAFREWVTIKAGFFDTYAWPNGKIRVEAQSISFAKMDEENFEQLYSNAIDVILQDVLVNYKRHDLDDLVMRVIRFAG